MLASAIRNGITNVVRVEVCQPTDADRAIVKHLFVFYRYDLMPSIVEGAGSRVNRWGVIGSDLETTHEASVADVDIWWTKPGVLMPMLIRADGMPAGFAMIARPPYAHASVDYRIEDFFILNRWRRAGVGSAAAIEVFHRLPGSWEVGWLPKNAAAAQFWRSVASRLGVQPDEWSVAQGPGAPGIPGLRMVIGGA